MDYLMDLAFDPMEEEGEPDEDGYWGLTIIGQPVDFITSTIVCCETLLTIPSSPSVKPKYCSQQIRQLFWKSTLVCHHPLLSDCILHLLTLPEVRGSYWFMNKPMIIVTLPPSGVSSMFVQDEDKRSISRLIQNVNTGSVSELFSFEQIHTGRPKQLYVKFIGFYYSANLVQVYWGSRINMSD